MLGWFKSKEVDALADSVVAELRELVPAGGIGNPKKKTARKLQKRFGAVFARVDTFMASRDLGLYAKARFANRVRWALKEAGYPPEFVEQLTDELALHVATAARRRQLPADR